MGVNDALDLMWGFPPGAGGGSSADPLNAYADQVMTLFGDDVLAYYPLWESDGPYVSDYSGQHTDEAFFGSSSYPSVDAFPAQPGIGDGRTSVYFTTGTGATIVLDNDSIKAAFNGNEGSILIWAKIANAGAWIDGQSHVLVHFGGYPNYINILKNSNNQLSFTYVAGAVQKQYNRPGVTSTDWMRIVATWSKSADEVRYYINGAQVGNTLTGLGNWGAVNPRGCIGAALSEPPSSNWNGWLAHYVLLNRAATPAEVAADYVLPQTFQESTPVTVAPAVIHVPSGGDIPAALATMRSGDILDLEADGSYTNADGGAGLQGIPAGHPMRWTTVRGNGATISGGLYAIAPGNKSFLSFDSLNGGAAGLWSLFCTNASYFRFTDCNFHNPASGTAYDTCRFDNCYNFTLTRCAASSTIDFDGPRAHDGFELWGPCANFVFIDCVAHDIKNGETQNEGHGFEIYAGDANDLVQNVRFINCEAYNCKVGFSVEGEPGSVTHDSIVCDGCSSHDNEFYGYQGIDGGVLHRIRAGEGDNTGNGVSETFGSVDDIAQAVTFTLRDDFTTTEAAPITTPRTSEPGPGTLDIYDTANRVSIVSGKLQLQGATTYVGARKAIDRVAGRALFFQIDNLNGKPIIGLNNSDAFATIENMYYGYDASVSGPQLSLSGTSGKVASPLSLSNNAAIVLGETGARLFLIANLGWELAWRWLAGADTPLYAILQGGILSSQEIDTFVVRDLPAPLNSDYGTSVINEAAPVSGTIYPAAINAIHDLTITAPDPLAESAELRFRVADATNYWRAYFTDAGALRIDSVLNGTPTNRLNVAGVIAAGETVTLRIYNRFTRVLAYTLAGDTWTHRGGVIYAFNSLNSAVVPVAGAGWTLGALRSDPLASDDYLELYRSLWAMT